MVPALSEGEDSSWDDNFYYDDAGRLRFVVDDLLRRQRYTSGEAQGCKEVKPSAKHRTRRAKSQDIPAPTLWFLS
jgi:hypothetical protein